MRCSVAPPLLALGALIGLVGCAPDARPSRIRGEVGSFDPSTYCELAARPGVVALSASTAIVCDEALDDPERALESCETFVASDDGRARRIHLDGARAVLRAADGRLVVLTADERLVLHDGNRELRELASWAAEPSLDASGRAVVFVGAPEGVGAVEPGDPTRLLTVELPNGRPTALLDDADASAPIFVPDASAVLYVSTASGVASIVRLARDTGAREILTNEGLVDLGQGFVPPYGEERAWVGARLVYESRTRDERSELWALDPTTGEATRIGEGAHPVAAGADEVLFLRESDGHCPATSSLAVTP